MFNPFAAFEPKFLSRFKEKGVKAFVRQTYERGTNRLDENALPAYLLTHFTDPNKAREHYEAIKSDPGRHLYNIDNDWDELQTMLNNPGGPKFFTILTIPNVNEKAQKHLDKKIRSYIAYKTNWKPARRDQVVFSLEVILGEIYVRLKQGPKEVNVKLDDFENQSYVL